MTSDAARPGDRGGRRLPRRRRRSTASARSSTRPPGREGPTRSPTTSSRSEVATSCPTHRLVDAYVSADGATAAVGAAAGRSASLEPFVNSGATTEGAALRSCAARRRRSSSPSGSELDPERARRRPASSAPSRSFEPEPPRASCRRTPSPTSASATRETSVDGAARPGAAAGPGLAAGFDGLVERARERGGDVDIERDLLPLLGDEARGRRSDRRGPAADPSAPGGEPRRPARERPGIPYLEFVADGVDEEQRARRSPRSRAPIASARSGGGRQAPTSSDRDRRRRGAACGSRRRSSSPTRSSTRCSSSRPTRPAIGSVDGREDEPRRLDAYSGRPRTSPTSVSLLAYLRPRAA